MDSAQEYEALRTRAALLDRSSRGRLEPRARTMTGVSMVTSLAVDPAAATATGKAEATIATTTAANITTAKTGRTTVDADLSRPDGPVADEELGQVE